MTTSRWQNVDGAFAAAPEEAAFWTGRTFDDFLFRPQKTDSQTRRKISVSSPIGKGLLGKMVGEVAEVVTPAGSTMFEIIEITR